MNRFSLCSGLFLALGMGLACPCSTSAAQEKPQRTLSERELENLLAHLEDKLGTIRSLKATFVQEKQLSLFSETVKSEGVIYFLRPDSVRFEMTSPFRSVLIARGKSVAKYEHIKGKWRKIRLRSPDAILMVTGQIASWLQGRFRDQDTIYHLSARTGDRTTVVLTPKHDKIREFIAAIELELGEQKDRIAAVVIREPGEDFTRMTFSNEQRDLALDPAIFNTKAPQPVPAGKPSAKAPQSARAKGERP